jgi:formate-dependent nitrite reductase membrane component NrfD
VPLPRSAYFRLIENRERGISSMNPDYPLILFVFLSRIAMGLGIVMGIFQLVYSKAPLIKFNVLLAFGLMLAATVFSITHLSAKGRFFAMARNLHSHISWEILLAGAYMVIMILYIIYIHLISLNTTGLTWLPEIFKNILFSSVVTYGLPIVMVCLSLLALISQGFAYHFPSHPAWKSPLLPFLYLFSAPTLGLFIVWTETHFFRTEGGYFSWWIFPLTIALLLGVQGVIIFWYFIDTMKVLRRGKEKTFSGERRGLFFLYPIFYLSIPLFAALIFLLSEGFSPFILIVGLLSMLMGTFLERILFFHLEEPIYFFNLSKAG